MKQNMLIIALLAVFVASVSIPVLAQPSPEGRQNTAIGASALSLLLFGTGNWIPGLVTGAGAWYAWDQYNQARNYQSYYGYQQPYGRGYYHPYSYGSGYSQRYYDPYSGRYYYGR